MSDPRVVDGLVVYARVSIYDETMDGWVQLIATPITGSSIGHVDDDLDRYSHHAHHAILCRYDHVPR
jgi:hypothetical protein